MGGRILLVCFCAYFICITKTGAIDMDYYFNSLRSSDCYTERGEKECRAYCGERDIFCHRGRCSCEESASKPLSQPNIEIVILDTKGQITYDSSKKVKDIKKNIENPVLNEMNLRPSLRHHIAHFCPNLDIARKCIRKCMESGKPAFCGKDHECYCGHKYSPHDKNSVANAEEVYKNFQDLYEKYFGKKPAGEDTIVESQF